jgi:hypothetical protein
VEWLRWEVGPGCRGDGVRVSEPESHDTSRWGCDWTSTPVRSGSSRRYRMARTWRSRSSVVTRSSSSSMPSSCVGSASTERLSPEPPSTTRGDRRHHPPQPCCATATSGSSRIDLALCRRADARPKLRSRGLVDFIACPRCRISRGGTRLLRDLNRCRHPTMKADPNPPGTCQAVHRSGGVPSPPPGRSTNDMTHPKAATAQPTHGSPLPSPEGLAHAQERLWAQERATSESEIPLIPGDRRFGQTQPATCGGSPIRRPQERRIRA